MVVFETQAKTPPRKKLNRKAKIINGTQATLAYQALLSTDPQNLTGGYHGGGVLISPNCILTAKHVIDGGSSSLKAYVGITTRSQATNPLGISEKVTFTGGPDLGLIFLNSPIPNASPIKLASESNKTDWVAGKSLQVSGFGIETSSSTGVSADCKRVSVNASSITDPNMIVCIGPGTNDACQGDSGGPLVISGSSLLAGVVSTDLFGNSIPTGSAKNNCGKGGRYVKVSKYLDWIVERIFINDAAKAPSKICAGQSVTFTNLPIVPDGCTFTWEASPSNLFAATSNTNNSTTFTVTAASNIGGLATIKLTFTAPDLSIKEVYKTIWVGRPGTIDITTDGTFNLMGNSASVCRTFGYSMTASTIPEMGITDYTWTGWGNINAFFAPSTTNGGIAQNKISFGNNTAGTYLFTIKAKNNCGDDNNPSTNTRMLYITVNNCGFRVFPNPASTLLTIDYETPDKVESIPKKLELIEEKSLKKVKEIVSNTKNNKHEINVSDLPRGIYYLKLSYGNDKKSDDNIKIILQ